MLGLSLGSDKACHPVGLFMVTITDSMGVSGDEDLIKLFIQHLSVIVYESDLPTFLHCYGCACTHVCFPAPLGFSRRPELCYVCWSVCFVREIPAVDILNPREAFSSAILWLNKQKLNRPVLSILAKYCNILF